MVTRMAYAVGVLVRRYGYPVNGAAGIVGNLWAESAVLPGRIEGSAVATPMRAKDFAGVVRDFTPDEIMTRDVKLKLGPKLPGVGLAQWTSSARRANLFKHLYESRELGTDVLFSVDAQLDYLAVELRTSYPGVHAVVSAADVALDAASDDIVYRFEIPGSILSGGKKLPRDDPKVQAVFKQRRVHGHKALAEYSAR